MSFVLSKKTTVAGEQPAVVAVDPRLLDAGDDVGVRDDEPLRGDPAGALDPEPARVADHPHDAQRGPVDALRPEHGRVGRGDARRRAGEDSERVDPREGVDQPRRRQLVVQRREDAGVPRVRPQPRLAREIEEDRADRPAEREPDRGAEEAARDVVEEAQRAEHGERLAEAVAELGAERLPDRPEHHRAREPDDGQPAREVAAHERRHDACTEVEPDEEAAEREDARHEPAPEPRERGERNQPDRDEVEQRHASRFARATFIPRYLEPPLQSLGPRGA